MKVAKAIDLYLDYHRLNSQKKNTHRTYGSILSKFRNQFSDRDPESISPDEVLSFLVGLNAFSQKFFIKFPLNIGRILAILL